MADLVPGRAPRVLGATTLVVLALALLTLSGPLTSTSQAVSSSAPLPHATSPMGSSPAERVVSPAGSALRALGTAPVNGTTYAVTFLLMPGPNAGFVTLNFSGTITKITSNETLELSPGIYELNETPSNVNLWTGGTFYGGPAKYISFQPGSLQVGGPGFVNATFKPVLTTISIISAPAGFCTNINVTVGGRTLQTDGTGGMFQAGVYNISMAGVCPGWKFVGFTTTGDVTLEPGGTELENVAGGTVTATFQLLWFTIQGTVEQWKANTSVGGATVHVTNAAGVVVNTTTASATGAWGTLEELYGNYTVYASAPGYQSSNVTVSVSSFNVNGIVAWLNLTIIGAEQQSAGGFLTSWPGVLIPLILVLVLVSSMLYVIIERTKKRRARPPPGPAPYRPPPARPGSVAPGAPPARLPPGRYPPQQRPPGYPPSGGGPYSR